MRKRGLAILMALITTIIAMSFSAGCHKEEWWEDFSKISVVLTDPLATPDSYVVELNDVKNKKNIKFTYNYDGEEHFPEAKIMVDGEEKGFVLREQKKIYIEEEGRYNSTPVVKHPGKHTMVYELYPTTDTSDNRCFSLIRIQIEIIK